MPQPGWPQYLPCRQQPPSSGWTYTARTACTHAHKHIHVRMHALTRILSLPPPTHTLRRTPLRWRLPSSSWACTWMTLRWSAFSASWISPTPEKWAAAWWRPARCGHVRGSLCLTHGGGHRGGPSCHTLGGGIWCPAWCWW